MLLTSWFAAVGRRSAGPLPTRLLAHLVLPMLGRSRSSKAVKLGIARATARSRFRLPASRRLWRQCSLVWS
eukprot:11217036-Lingulodinium_polyedra.AAC.1